ncbi:MAG: Gfo/Idh/MocA family oxidoreductase [Planctomycetes bacterium]|nr:Gfo/Idh/MocA family oxidoreductase [Planctomycetota bacterium]
MSSEKLRVALIGCGQIADAHLGEIRKLAHAEPVAVCDRERDLAVQAAARFEVPQIFDDVEQMLATARPDVVHITTPPHTHKALAIAALRGGAHVYVEKPFTVDVAEADEVIAVAESAGRLACVGHDQLFDPCWVECRQLFEKGNLGDIVHVDSVQGYDLTGIFGRLVSSDPEHWVRRLPGGVFQNTISHALYKITEFLPDTRPHIQALWFPTPDSGGLKSELRVMLRGEQVTASLISSFAARPVQRLARIYGTKDTVEVDLEARLVRKYYKLSAPGPFAKIEGPYRQSKEAKRNFWKAVRKFWKSDLQYFAGMNGLFDRFYRAILTGGPPPITHGEIRRVTDIMDRIFATCQQQELEFARSNS